MTRRVARRYPYATSFYIDADTKTACKELAKSMSILSGTDADQARVCRYDRMKKDSTTSRTEAAINV